MKTEDDPFNQDPPEALRRTLEAILYLERAVPQTDGVDGTVLRYGGFYGQGTSLGEGGFQLEGVRRRRFPVGGGGTGVSSFIHIDDAAATTLAAIESAKPGLYNIVDDDPAPVVEWLPALAEAIRQASPGSPRVAGSPVRRSSRGGHDDGGTRGLQRQGKARPRVAALLPELERRGSGGARKLRSSKAA